MLIFHPQLTVIKVDTVAGTQICSVIGRRVINRADILAATGIGWGFQFGSEWKVEPLLVSIRLLVYLSIIGSVENSHGYQNLA